VADINSRFALIGLLLAGQADLGAGRLDTASLLLESVAEQMRFPERIGWGYRCQVPLAVVLAMRGLTDEAAAVLNTLEKQRHPAWRYVDYEYAIARAWVAGGQGAVSEAIALVLAAAETAHGNGQFAAEVMCLQTAAQFGDRSCGPRLRQLQGMVEGPRAGIAAGFAEALHAGDAYELAAVSDQFEAMGDRVAAIDAAAHAAIAYRHADRRGSALRCSTRAAALAEQCGGARTPALSQAAEPLPLTNREREVVMLLGEGLSNRDIAERLTVSIRTVEDHIYKAMAKTGATRRDELAALLFRPQKRQDDKTPRQLN
jgi:DNA-binding CsgD family transcriptional regulator